MPRTRWVAALTLVALTTCLALFLGEAAKSLAILPTWPAQLITIMLGTVTATLASGFALLGQQARYRRVFKELAIRKRPDETARVTARAASGPGPSTQERDLRIAQRLEAAEALLAGERSYRSLVESSLHGICVQRDGIIQFANPAAAAMFDYEKPEDLVGQRYSTLVAPRKRSRLEERATARGASAPHRFECESTRRDGTPVWVEWLESPITWQGKFAILASFVDISDRKRAEPAKAALAATADEVRETTEPAEPATSEPPVDMSHSVAAPSANVIEMRGLLETEWSDEPQEIVAITGDEVTEDRQAGSTAAAGEVTPKAGTRAQPRFTAPVAPALESPRRQSEGKPPEPPPSAVDGPATPSAMDGPAPVDVAALLESLGDLALGEMVGTFLGYCPERVDALRAAIVEGDSSRVERTAHSLKRAVGSFQAERARALAAELEAMGREGTLERAPDTLARLEAELERVSAVLASAE